ncbi:oxidoreductase [Lasiosphaeria miniovina]|uniref:Oxidoreductase n=1 Tax=Lasiosphaeria miniovina TaxID=1954250 RepID=A0AA40ATZ3_9PEZI|nr:oxidoreductase [Lasiosphaeria miniovina]KAK0721943.1 oxidoreductase [Lasiosphaeria miniovina]
MSNLRVLIVGASIAGPTAAYWFAKAGAKVTVVERFPHIRPNGQNVDIRTVGVTVMRRTPGMEAAVRAKVMPYEGISFVGSNGRPFGIIRATGNPDQQSLVSEYEILRGDLSQILFDMTKDNENISYVFGEQVASMQQHEQEDGPVTVEFANGFPASEFDLVVACDGATSRTRALGLGCGVRDHIKSINCWVAYFSTQQDILDGSKLGQSYSAPGGRWIAAGSNPAGGSRVTLMGLYPRDNLDITRSFRSAMAQGDVAFKQHIAQHFKGAGWKCDEAIEGMMGSPDFYASEIAQVKPPSLCKGRFVLVGDAGYAAGPTGGGTSLAIAGAYVLAGEISKHKGDLAAGLQGYEERMRPIIDDLQKIPFLVPTVLAPQTTWGLWVRNSIIWFICWTRVMQFSQRFFANSYGSGDKYRLPEYSWDK